MSTPGQMAETWAIILAAGESKRMKTQKLLLPFDGQTIIGKVIENAVLSEADKIMVVLGSHRESILAAIKDMPVCCCYNEDYREGMHTSVICGFGALPASASAALVFLGDQPFIPPIVSNLVIDTWKKTGKGIVIPVFGGKRGHPSLYDLKYREEISRLDKVSGLRSVALNFPEDVIEIETGSQEITRDIDTKNDYLNELNQIK
jgi:molybdenum cofactor cytidylyltransferase